MTMEQQAKNQQHDVGIAPASTQKQACLALRELCGRVLDQLAPVSPRCALAKRAIFRIPDDHLHSAWRSDLFRLNWAGFVVMLQDMVIKRCAEGTIPARGASITKTILDRGRFRFPRFPTLEEEEDDDAEEDEVESYVSMIETVIKILHPNGIEDPASTHAGDSLAVAGHDQPPDEGLMRS